MKPSAAVVTGLSYLCFHAEEIKCEIQTVGQSALTATQTELLQCVKRRSVLKFCHFTLYSRCCLSGVTTAREKFPSHQVLINNAQILGFLFNVKGALCYAH